METVRYPSCCKIGPGTWGVTVANPFFETKFSHNVMACRVDTLVEHFGLPRPNYIKLDVDGAELNILKGSEQTIKSESFKSLLVELDERDKESFEYLNGLGLTFKGKYTVGSKNPDNRRFNFIFEKN